MKQLATVYDYRFQPRLDPKHARIECYLKLPNGQIIVIEEEGTIDYLSTKYQFRRRNKIAGVIRDFRNRNCELVEESNSFRFNKFID